MWSYLQQSRLDDQDAKNKRTIQSSPDVADMQENEPTSRSPTTTSLNRGARSNPVKSVSNISSSADPSCATPAPPSVSSSSSASIPNGPGRYTSRCRCTCRLLSNTNTRSLTLRIESETDALSIAIVAPVIATTDMRLYGLPIARREHIVRGYTQTFSTNSRQRNRNIHNYAKRTISR